MRLVRLVKRLPIATGRPILPSFSQPGVDAIHDVPYLITLVVHCRQVAERGLQTAVTKPLLDLPCGRSSLMAIRGESFSKPMQNPFSAYRSIGTRNLFASFHPDTISAI